MITCVVYQCNKLATYRFPKDPDLRSKWIKKINRKNWKPHAESRVCADHFLPSDFLKENELGYYSNRRTLRKGSVPSVFKMPETKKNHWRCAVKEGAIKAKSTVPDKLKTRKKKVASQNSSATKRSRKQGIKCLFEDVVDAINEEPSEGSEDDSNIIEVNCKPSALKDKGDGIIIKEEQEDFAVTCQASYWGPILPVDTASFTSSEIKTEEFLGTDGVVIKEEPDNAVNDWEVVQPTSGENTLTVAENIKVETSAEDGTLGRRQLSCGSLLLNDFRTLSSEEQVSCNEAYKNAVEGAEKTSNSEKFNEVSSNALTDKDPFLFNGRYYKCAGCLLWCSPLSDIATQIREGSRKTRTVPEVITRNSMHAAKVAEKGNTNDTKTQCEAKKRTVQEVVTRNSWHAAKVAEKKKTKDTKAKCEAKTRTVQEVITRNSLHTANVALKGNTNDTKAQCEAKKRTVQEVVTRNSLHTANVAEKGNTSDTKAKCEANFSSQSSVRKVLQSTYGPSVPAKNSPDTPIEKFPTSDLDGEKNARDKLEMISFLQPFSFKKISKSNLLAKENPFPSGNSQTSLPKASSRPKFPERLSHLSNLSTHKEFDSGNSPSKGLQSSLLKNPHSKNLQSSLLKNSRSENLQSSSLKNSHSNHFQSSLLTTENPVPAGNLKTPLAYACSKCREIFLNLSDLCKHERLHYGKSTHNLLLLSCDSKTTNLSENVLGLRQNLLKDFPASCGECLVCFSSLDTLTAHILEQHESPKNIQTSFEKLLTSCFKCNMYFCSLPALAKHISRWHKNRKRPKNKQILNIISCVKCNKYFTSLYILTKHMFSSHKKPLLIKPSIKIFHFPCSRCKIRFKLQSDLQKHMRCHRPLIRNKFTCEKCKMSFTLRFALNKHMKAHTGNASKTENLPMQKRVKKKRLACEKCNMTFTLQFALNKHMQTHCADVMLTTVEPTWYINKSLL